MQGLQVAACFYFYLFLFAFLGKLDRRGSWQTTVALMISHRRLRMGLSVIIPLIELAVGATILIEPGISFLCASVLLAFFGIGVISANRRHAGVECGCFGAFFPSRIGLGLAVRNLGFAMLAGVFGWLALAQDATAPGLDLLVSTAFGALAVALLVEFDRVQRAEGGSLPRILLDMVGGRS